MIEKLALVKFSDEEGIKTMEKSINFVDPLNEIDTENVEPMISLLEDRYVSSFMHMPVLLSKHQSTQQT